MELKVLIIQWYLVSLLGENNYIYSWGVFIVSDQLKNWKIHFDEAWIKNGNSYLCCSVHKKYSSIYNL